MSFNVKNTKDLEFIKFKAQFDEIKLEKKLLLKEIFEQKRIRIKLKRERMVLRRKKAIEQGISISDIDDSEEEEDEDTDEDGEDSEIENDERLPKNIWIVKPGEYTNCGYGI
jgi:hypothetical protein